MRLSFSLRHPPSSYSRVQLKQAHRHGCTVGRSAAQRAGGLFCRVPCSSYTYLISLLSALFYVYGSVAQDRHGQLVSRWCLGK